MAAKENEVKTYIVTVTTNKDFCGIGAGGVHFAHGKAEITDPRLAAWFKDHDGYKVEEKATPAE